MKAIFDFIEGLLLVLLSQFALFVPACLFSSRIMIMKGFQRNFITVFFIIIMIMISITKCWASGFIFGDSGQYVVISSKDYQIVEQDTIWSKMPNEKMEEILGDRVEERLSNVVSDIERNRVFLYIGFPQKGYLDGALVLNRKHLGYIGWLKRPSLTGNDPILTSSDGTKVYVGFEIYDGKTFKMLKNYDETRYELPSGYKGPLFEIGTESCFLENDNLYTHNVIFDVRTDPPKLIKSVTHPGFNGLPMRCRNGNVLYVTNEGTDWLVAVLYDVKNDKIVTKAKAKGSSLLAEDWYLSKDLKYIIRDERRTASVGEGTLHNYPVRIGNLQIFGVESGSLKTEIQIPVRDTLDSKVIGFSGSGDLLFYQTKNAVYIVSLSKLSVVAGIILPEDFRPVGVVWE